MKQKQIDQFFKNLDRCLNQYAEIILVGASAGALMGHIRPSLDIDFEIRLKNRRFPRSRLAALIDEAARSTGVAVNYSENVGGWSMISYLDYRKTASPYKKIGLLNVKIIAPDYWTIGKMARFLELDIQDMIKIIKRKKLKAAPLIKIWGRAASASDLSLELGQFRDHVVYFLSRYARRLWGKKANPKKWTRSFIEGID